VGTRARDRRPLPQCVACDLARSSGPGPRLVELVPAAPSRVDARYVVRVVELAVEIGDDFCEETLARLVRTLRSC